MSTSRSSKPPVKANRKRVKAAQPRETSVAGSSSALEAQLGYTFREPELLRLALTHRSYEYEARGGAANPAASDLPTDADNEQMEFLGDAVLGMVVTEALFRRFPQCHEGELTRMRAVLVSRESMARFGVELGLGEHLRMGPGMDAQGGRTKPNVLANAAEAVMAAMFLDRGGSDGDGLRSVRALLENRLLEPHMAELQAALDAAGADTRAALRDYKTLLQERVQAEPGAGSLRYVDVGEEGPAHQRTFSVEARLDGQVLARASGRTKKAAQQEAARLVLEAW